MTKKQAADIEKLLNEYSFLDMYNWNNGRKEDSSKNFARVWAVRRVLVILGYGISGEKAKREGITYNHYKVEKRS